MRILGITRKGKERLAKAERIGRTIARYEEFMQKLGEATPVLNAMETVNDEILGMARSGFGECLGEYFRAEFGPENFVSFIIFERAGSEEDLIMAALGSINSDLSDLFKELSSSLEDISLLQLNQIIDIRKTMNAGRFHELKDMQRVLENPTRNDKKNGLLKRADELNIDELEEALTQYEDILESNEGVVEKTITSLPSILLQIRERTIRICSDMCEILPPKIVECLNVGIEEFLAGLRIVQDDAAALHFKMIQEKTGENGPPYR